MKLTPRHATRNERAFHKCLSTLRTLQKERRAAENEAAAEAKAETTASAAQTRQFVSQNSKNPNVAREYAPECASDLPSGFPVSGSGFVIRSTSNVRVIAAVFGLGSETTVPGRLVTVADSALIQSSSAQQPKNSNAASGKSNRDGFRNIRNGNRSYAIGFVEI